MEAVPNGPIASTTQVKRPWRAVLRTCVQAFLAFVVIYPQVLSEAGADTRARWAVLSLALCAAITRIMALPSVEGFLQRYVPFLAADKRPPTSLP